MSQGDADTVTPLALMDCLHGPDRMAWRINEWLNGNTLSRDHDNLYAVCAAMAAALTLLLKAFAED